MMSAEIRHVLRHWGWDARFRLPLDEFDRRVGEFAGRWRRSLLLVLRAPGAEIAVAGSELRARLAMDPAGLPFRDLFGEADRASADWCAETAREEGLAVLLGCATDAGPGRPPCGVEGVVVPLCVDGGQARHAVCYLDLPGGRAGRGRRTAPLRLQLRSLRPVSGRPQADAAAIRFGLAGERPGFGRALPLRLPAMPRLVAVNPQPAPSARRGKLRLV